MPFAVKGIMLDAALERMACILSRAELCVIGCVADNHCMIPSSDYRGNEQSLAYFTLVRPAVSSLLNRQGLVHTTCTTP